MRKLTIAVIIGIMIGGIAFATNPVGAGHEAGNPTWDPGYPMRVKCGGQENVLVQWRVLFEDKADWDTAFDRRMHVFLRALNVGPRTGVPVDMPLHWNSEEAHIVRDRPFNTRWAVVWKAVYPTSQLRLETAWVDTGNGAVTDGVQVLTVDCIPKTHADSATFLPTVGNPAHTH